MMRSLLALFTPSFVRTKTNVCATPGARLRALLLPLALAAAVQVHAAPAPAVPGASPSPLQTTVLIIRHADKPAEGRGLSPTGLARARAYVPFFSQLQLDSQALTPTALYATADSRGSERARLTLTPLAQSLHLPLDTRFPAKQIDPLVDAVRAGPPGRVALICWHHGEIPALLRALGADPAQLLPDGRWPGRVFDWMVVLRLDARGRLIPGSAQRLTIDVLHPAPAGATAVAP